MAIGGWANNAELIADCARLGYLRSDWLTLDPTYGNGRFWTFPDGYIPATLTKKDRVKLAGNAVTPPVMAWIVGRIVQALEAAS